MDDNFAIKVHDLHKSFDLAENKHTSIKQVLINTGRKNYRHRQKVLDGVDFTINKGEFFGIVGRNGSGKSTLLKLLAGVYTPDAGSVEINGKITPFIELGVGFNAELTGRDNVYLSASLLGFTRKQVDAIYNDIVEFSELHDHMDKKLKNYSSGMQVRLAFSIAVKAKNDILIFDEVLAVGDEAFQKKCIRIFEEYRRKKQTVILVTHSMENVRELCTRGLMLSGGKVELIGSVKKVTEAYSRSNQSPSEDNISHAVGDIQGINLEGCEPSYKPGDAMHLAIDWPAEKEVAKIGVAIMSSKDELVFASNTGTAVVESSSIEYKVDLNVGPGRYFLTVAMYDSTGKNVAFFEKRWSFVVYDDYRDEVGGQVRLSYMYKQGKRQS